MTLSKVKELLGAEILCGESNMEQEILSACGSDMMSDVLAFVKEQSMLLTGLVNPQVMRTAEMMDMRCIVFVRGKRPDQPMLDLAESHGMVVMNTPLRMYPSCGRLYEAGLKGENA
ncbi:MAG: DRTGG domain-containing protein [Oscillospiraceae bacterium]|nr:DRTGG domain-containing protein [Oscillospiraceae bacterium]